MKDSFLKETLVNTKSIAIVGLSKNWNRPSNFVAKYLIDHGYDVVPVNPRYDEIFGLDQMFDNGFVFHAGTKKQDVKIVTNGGRVLGVTGLGDTLESAIKHAYEITEKISWENKYLRTDIGKKGLSYL